MKNKEITSGVKPRWTWYQCLLLLIALVVILIPAFGFKTSLLTSSHLTLRYLPTIISNGLMILIPMIFGTVYGRKRRDYNEAFKIWLIAVATLIVYYIAFFIVLPSGFTMWRVFGVFFPISSSLSPLFSGLVLALLAEPWLYDWLNRSNRRYVLALLLALTIAACVLSAGLWQFQTTLESLYLLLPFTWGMALTSVHLKPKSLWSLIAGGVLSVIIIVIATPGLREVYDLQSASGAFVNQRTWNVAFLANPTSPLIYLLVFALFFIFKSFFSQLSRRQLHFLIPAIVIADAPISVTLTSQLHLVSQVWGNRGLILLAMLIGIVLVAGPIDSLLMKWPLIVKVQKVLITKKRLWDVFETSWLSLTRWVKRHHVFLLTAIYFWLLSLLSILLQSDKPHVQISTLRNVNAIVYLLGLKSFVIVLTALFLAASFAIFYFLTTRYWVSLTLVSVITIGWSLANKIKVGLRGAPIYPTDLKELVNWQTLIPMVGVDKIIGIGIFLLVLIGIIAFIEYRFPIRFGDFKQRGIGLIIAILLFLTPFRANHDGSIIQAISRAFDNQPSFLNPQRDVQTNGPVLNFLSYYDLQIMDRPQDYSRETIAKVARKYTKVAAKINKTRHQSLKKQTIIFNLSESFMDPTKAPTVKFSKSAQDPISFIHSMANKSTYGKMLSAGYGGGTADMEYETLTGFNMGYFRTSLTPYVQIVPNFRYYPTIGANFDYSSGIHPFIGTYYSRIEDYKRFKFNKFVYLGSKYKISDQRRLGTNQYLSDFTAYDNGLKQVKAKNSGQFINLITIQNHMPYDDWYKSNAYRNEISGKVLNSAVAKTQYSTYTKGTQYTDEAVDKFIHQIDAIKKPITLVFYGDHYPAIISQSYLDKYPIALHATTYFIYSNRYAREHGAKMQLKKRSYVNTSDFIAMMLQQTNSKVTPYQALLTKIYQDLPAITINYQGQRGFELVNQKGKRVSEKKLTAKQRRLIKEAEMIQYDMTAGKGYGTTIKGFYK